MPLNVKQKNKAVRLKKFFDSIKLADEKKSDEPANAPPARMARRLSAEFVPMNRRLPQPPPLGPQQHQAHQASLLSIPASASQLANNHPDEETLSFQQALVHELINNNAVQDEDVDDVLEQIYQEHEAQDLAQLALADEKSSDAALDDDEKKSDEKLDDVKPPTRKTRGANVGKLLMQSDNLTKINNDETVQSMQGRLRQKLLGAPFRDYLTRFFPDASPQEIANSYQLEYFSATLAKLGDLHYMYNLWELANNADQSSLMSNARYIVDHHVKVASQFISEEEANLQYPNPQGMVNAIDPDSNYASDQARLIEWMRYALDSLSEISKALNSTLIHYNTNKNEAILKKRVASGKRNYLNKKKSYRIYHLGAFFKNKMPNSLQKNDEDQKYPEQEEEALANILRTSAFEEFALELDENKNPVLRSDFSDAQYRKYYRSRYEYLGLKHAQNNVLFQGNPYEGFVYEMKKAKLAAEPDAKKTKKKKK